MSKKHVIKKTLAGFLAALMMVTSVPATSLVVFAEETPIEAVDTNEMTAIVAAATTETEETTSVERTGLTTEETTVVDEAGIEADNSTAEETTTSSAASNEEDTIATEEVVTEAEVETDAEAETTTEEVALTAEEEQKFKFIFVDEDNLAVLTIYNHEGDEDQDFSLSDFSAVDGVYFSVEFAEPNDNYAIDQVKYKIGGGEYTTVERDGINCNIPYNKLNGDNITITYTLREITLRTVTFDVDPDAGDISYFVSKTATPTDDDYWEYKTVEPQSGKVVIKVEDKYYLYIIGIRTGNAKVIKDGNDVKYTYNEKLYSSYYALGQITKDTTGISVDVALRAETSIEYDRPNSATVNYASGYYKNVSPSVYYGFDGSDDFRISVVPKTGYSIEKVELVPLISEPEYWDDESCTMQPSITTEADEGVVEFAEDSTHANWYKVDKDTLRSLMRTKKYDGEYSNWRYMGCNDHGTLQFKIKVTTKTAQLEVTLPGEESGVEVHLAKLRDANATELSDKYFVEEELITSATVDYNGDLYLAVQICDPIHKVFGSMTKASGTATFTKVDSDPDTVFYKLSGIKSAVALKATLTDKKAAGGAEFIINNTDTDKNTIKVTGAAYNKTTGNYIVNKNATQIVVTVTTPAPYIAVRDLGEGEIALSTQAPKAAGKNYAWTFTIPAVDITNPEEASGIVIPEYDFGTVYAVVSVRLEKDDDDVQLDSVMVGTSQEPTMLPELKWDVPFGSTVTFSVSPKDNCKVTAAYVNGKKAALAGGKKLTYKVTDLTEDTVLIVSQKLLKTVVESGETTVTAKGTTYNVLKQNACSVYVKEGAEGKLDLTGKTISATVGRDNVDFTVYENVVKFTAAEFDKWAGKTITVTIKDGKKVVSTSKLVVSAKCTSVKVQGEKKVNGVDTIYMEMASKSEPKFKVTYNTGVDLSDISLSIKAAGSEDELQVPINGEILGRYFLKTNEESELIREYELVFKDNTQGNKTVAIKKLIVTTSGFEKAAPTIKVVSSNDTSVTLSITNPKVNGNVVQMLDYTIKATQVVAKGKEPVADMYDTKTFTQNVVTSSLITLPLTGNAAGEGKACNYSFEISANFAGMINVSIKTVTVKGATKTPAYEKNLKLTAKKAAFYQQEGPVLVATAKFSAATTHTEDLKASLYVYVNNVKYYLADNSTDEDAKGGITIDGTDIYVNLPKDKEKQYPAAKGYYLEVEAAKDPDADKASTAVLNCTLLEPIKEINLTYTASEYQDEYYPVYRVQAGKAYTIAAPKVDFGTHENYSGGEVKIVNNNPKSKSISWSVDAISCQNLQEVEGVSIDPKTGKITVAKNVDVSGGIEITVTAKANDFATNTIKTESTIYIAEKTAFDVKIISTNDAYSTELLPDYSNEITLRYRHNDYKLAPVKPTAGATYTYESSDSSLMAVDEEGNITLESSANNYSAVITVTEKKGTITKIRKVKISFRYEPT